MLTDPEFFVLPEPQAVSPVSGLLRSKVDCVMTNEGLHGAPCRLDIRVSTQVCSSVFDHDLTSSWLAP